jgi:hypothetical protein
MKNTKISRFSIATASLFAAFAQLTHGKVVPQNLVSPSANCAIEQEEPILKTGASKKLNRSVSLRLCGGDYLLWLSESDASGSAQSASRNVQVFKLPALGPGEKYDIAVGSCAIKKKPVMSPMVMRANWGKKSKIQYNSGLVSTWWYDSKSDAMVERKVVGLICRSDAP